MSPRFAPVVEDLIRAKMASGRYQSEDELLLDALSSLEEAEHELRAIEEGLDSVDRGDEGVPVDEAFRNLRERHDIPNLGQQ